MKRLLAATLLASLSISTYAATITANASLDYGQNVDPSNPVPSTATGIGTFMFDDVAGTVDIFVEVDGIFQPDITFPAAEALSFDNLGPVHLHLGAAGENGGIVLPFDDPSVFSVSGSGFRVIAFGVPFDLGGLPSVLAGDVYINVHTLDYASGEIRGQLTVIPLPAGALLMLGPLALLARRSV